jgi:hypothetical protein
MMHFKDLEKQEQSKHEITKPREIIKIGAEIHEI